jgi:capsular polysaccharide export protein
MGIISPILRSPPFPGVEVDVAKVSRIGKANAVLDDIPALFARIRAARVGGAFWARDPIEAGLPGPLACPTSPADITDMVAACGGGPIRILFPAAGWARRAAKDLRDQGHEVIVGSVDPWSLIERATVVHTHGGEELAALAAIADIPVQFHSDGRFGTSRSSQSAVIQTVARNLMTETCYRDPFSAVETDIVATIDRLREWRCLLDANRAIGAAHGIAWWKRDEIERFLWTGRSARLVFTRSRRRALAVARRTGTGVAVWPSRISPALIDEATAMDVPLIRVEDGFVRSVGLGSALFPPFSVAADKSGIHYDPSQPSDLEQLLQTADFGPGLIARAEALRAFITAAGIGKYGAAARVPHRFVARDPNKRRLVLVAGQVEGDMSVLLGGGGITSNLDLLARARALEADAEIWFRPHPDVDAGHRRGAIADADALRHADRVVRGGGMAQLLDIVDGVHVLTSLTGFEALLRDRDVTTHGVPFYAGWGLTQDRGDVPPRRTRRLTLTQLVAGVLILYPRYLDPVTGLPCPVEVLVERLAGISIPPATWLTRARSVQGRLMRGRR